MGPSVPFTSGSFFPSDAADLPDGIAHMKKPSKAKMLHCRGTGDRRGHQKGSATTKHVAPVWWAGVMCWEQGPDRVRYRDGEGFK